MRLPLKPTILTKPTILLPLHIIRTPMPINTPCIIALRPILARRHAAHVSQRLQLILLRLEEVVVRAGVVGAVVS